jgi:hypothetical protein
MAFHAQARASDGHFSMYQMTAIGDGISTAI